MNFKTVEVNKENTVAHVSDITLKIGQTCRAIHARTGIRFGHTPIWAGSHTVKIIRFNEATVTVELLDEPGNQRMRIDYADLLPK